MSKRSVAGLVVVTMGVLLAVGSASRAQPLFGHRRQVSATTVDLVIVVVFCVVAALIVALAIESHRPESTARRRAAVGDVVFTLVLLAALTAGAYGLGRAFGSDSHPTPSGVSCARYERAHGKPTSQCAVAAPPAKTKRSQHTAAHAASRSSWLPITAIIALLAGGGALVALGRRRPSAPREEAEYDRRAAVVEALDLSIDDLRQETDPRRAIIAAYARMETTFTAAGLPPHPSEAPQEFLARALRELDASAGAAARLTDLFEVAKFSQHPADAQMRDEAIDGLLAVRDELTDPARLPEPRQQSGGVRRQRSGDFHGTDPVGRA